MGQVVEKESHAVSGFELTKLVYEKNVAKSFNLKMSSFAVLIALTNHYNPAKRLVFPSIMLLCERLNCAKSTIILAIDDLIAKGLILKIKKGKRNAYSFTSALFEYLEINRSEKRNNRNDNQSDRYENQTCLYITNKKEIKEKEVVFSLKNLSEFQKRYIDVFEKLSEKELQEYKKLQGFDKEPWLIGKRRAFKDKEKSIAQRKLQKEYAENACCPLDWSKDEQLAFYKGLPPILKNSYYAKAIREKWGLA